LSRCPAGHVVSGCNDLPGDFHSSILVPNDSQSIRKNPLTERHSEFTETPYSKDGWKIVECVSTGMVYLANPPAYSALSEEFAWEKTYQKERERRLAEEPVWSKLSSGVKRLRNAIRSRERIISEALLAIQSVKLKSESISSIRMIDIGCGDGDKSALIAQELKKLENAPTLHPIGIEVSKALSKETNDKLKRFGGRCVNSNAIDGLASLADESSDIILLCSFLEHEVNPLALLREAARVLTRNGLIIIKVPNYASINRRVRKARWCGFRYPDHVNYFTPKTLRQTIESSRLKINRMNFIDTIPTSDNMWVIASR